MYHFVVSNNKTSKTAQVKVITLLPILLEELNKIFCELGSGTAVFNPNTWGGEQKQEDFYEFGPSLVYRVSPG